MLYGRNDLHTGAYFPDQIFDSQVAADRWFARMSDESEAPAGILLALLPTIHRKPQKYRGFPISCRNPAAKLQAALPRGGHEMLYIGKLNRLPVPFIEDIQTQKGIPLGSLRSIIADNQLKLVLA